MKREADTKKGALLNIVESMKTEHGINTASEAKEMITDLEKKVTGWEQKRDELTAKIEAALDGQEGIKKLLKDSLDDADEDFDKYTDDDFDDFDDN